METKIGIGKRVNRKQRQGKHQAYNFEIHQTHNYFVSELGILVYNMSKTIVNLGSLKYNC